jgi:hypothetical protein
MLSEDYKTQANEAGKYQIKSDQVVQESRKNQNQDSEQDREQRSDIDDHQCLLF